MRVLGIDPGLRIAGYGCIDYKQSMTNPILVEAGAIKLNTKQTVSFRLAQLYKDIQEIISELKPELLAIETVFTHERHVTTATILGHARGVLLLAGEQASLPLIELTPAEIKKSMTGNRNRVMKCISIVVTAGCDDHNRLTTNRRTKGNGYT